MRGRQPERQGIAPKGGGVPVPPHQDCCPYSTPKAFPALTLAPTAFPTASNPLPPNRFHIPGARPPAALELPRLPPLPFKQEGITPFELSPGRQRLMILKIFYAKYLDRSVSRNAINPIKDPGVPM